MSSKAWYAEGCELLLRSQGDRMKPSAVSCLWAKGRKQLSLVHAVTNNERVNVKSLHIRP